MKKIPMAILAAAAGLFAVISCTPKADLPVIGAIGDSEIVRDGDKQFELDYRFEYISDYGNKDVLQKIQWGMAEDFFGEDYLKETPEATAKAYHDEMIDGYREAITDGYAWDGFQKTRSHTQVLNERILVYTVESSSYMGGAHGMETVTYSNYDLATGDKLTLDDLFSPESKTALAEKIHEQILKNHDASDWDALMVESCYFAKEEIEPTENFELSETHITFLYNPYDIACYAQGRTKVKLALDGLEGFRREVLGN